MRSHPAAEVLPIRAAQVPPPVAARLDHEKTSPVMPVDRTNVGKYVCPNWPAERGPCCKASRDEECEEGWRGRLGLGADQRGSGEGRESNNARRTDLFPQSASS